MSAAIHEPAASFPVVSEHDVAVIGGGLAGFAAAARARDSGLSAVIIEERGSLGREAWASLQVFPRGAGVSPATTQQSTPPLPPIAIEIRDRLGAVNAWTDTCFDAPALQLLLDRMTAERDIAVQFQSFGERVLRTDDDGLAVVIGNKSGRQAIRCRHVIDATENARMLVSAGVAMTQAPAGSAARRAMLFVGTEDAPPECCDTYLLPAEIDTVQHLAHGRHTMWPGETIVWADFDDITHGAGAPPADRADLIYRETHRRLLQIAEHLHGTVGQFRAASLMLVGHDPLWLCGRVLAEAVSDTEAITFALAHGRTTNVPVPVSWLDPPTAGGVIGCGPWLDAPDVSAVDYAELGNALRLGDACARQLN